MTTVDISHAPTTPAARAKTEPAATEASVLPRIITLLTPLFAVMAVEVANWIARVAGAVVDQTQLTALMAVAAGTASGAAWKWMSGWRQYERLVAEGLDVPRKRGPNAPARPGLG